MITWIVAQKETGKRSAKIYFNFLKLKKGTYKTHFQSWRTKGRGKRKEKGNKKVTALQFFKFTRKNGNETIDFAEVERGEGKERNWKQRWKKLGLSCARVIKSSGETENGTLKNTKGINFCRHLEDSTIQWWLSGSIRGGNLSWKVNVLLLFLCWSYISLLFNSSRLQYWSLIFIENQKTECNIKLSFIFSNFYFEG